MDKFNATISSSNASFNANFNQATAAKNNVFIDTKERWDAQSDLVSAQNCLYVYSDYQVMDDNTPIAGFKVGDGVTYLINLPFSGDLTNELIGQIEESIVQINKQFEQINGRLEQVERMLTAPEIAGTYQLSATVVDGEATYSWEDCTIPSATGVDF